MSIAHSHDIPQGRALTPAQLKALSVKSNFPGAVRSLSHFGAIALTGTLLWMVMNRYGVLFALPLIPIQGYLVAFLFMPVHEAAHKTVFRTKSLNSVLGHAASLTIMYPLEYYTLFHWDHHRFTQDPWIPENKRTMVVTEARLYALVYAVLLVGSIALSSTLLLWVWLLPLVVGQWFLRPYLFAEHTGCDHTRSAFENTRTTYTGQLMKWFTWNMPFHVEHHAYPSVPFHALPKLNAIVDDRIAHRGRGYLTVTRETLAWFRRERQSAL
jgi:fatty acid desaturase